MLPRKVSESFPAVTLRKTFAWTTYALSTLGLFAVPDVTGTVAPALARFTCSSLVRCDVPAPEAQGALSIAVYAFYVSAALLAIGLARLLTQIRPSPSLHQLVGAPAKTIWDALQASNPSIIVTKSEHKCLIAEDFSVCWEQKFVISTTGAPLGGIPFEVFGQPECSRFEDTQFEAEDLSGGTTSVLALPARDDHSDKLVVVFLHPPLQPSDEARTIAIRWKWPESGRRLRSANGQSKDSHVVQNRLLKPVAELTLSVEVKTKGNFSHDLEISDCTTPLRAPAPTASSGRTLTWELKEVPPGTKLTIVTKRTG